MIKFFCGTSTLMLVRGQFVNCVFALHAPVCSSAAILQAPHHQPPNQWILGCRCLQVLKLCLVQPRLWPQSQWKPVCIHLLAASFVCAVKTIFLLRTSDKVQKTMGPGIEPICGTYCGLWDSRSPDLEGSLQDVFIYFGTPDNTFSFYFVCSDWHHDVFLLPTKRRVCGPLGFIVPR